MGVYDEEMQNRQYGIPEKPVLRESEKLYNWAVGEDEYEDDPGDAEELEDGPMVEVRGENPRYLTTPIFAFLGGKHANP